MRPVVPHAIIKSSGFARFGQVLILAVSAYISLCITPALAQQTTADIVGTVTDASGGVVKDAKVTAQNLGTNETRTTQTSGAGDYAFNLLPIGHYSVTIEAPGFKAFNVPDIAVAAGDRARVNAQLQVGQQAETVTVTAESPALQTDSSSLGDTINDKAVQDLPLNGRNFVDLVQLTPGVNAGPSNSIASGQRPDDRRQSSAFSANGQSDLLNNSQIDGLDNNDRAQGFIGVRPSIDGIAEIRVTTNDYTAEVGRSAGAVVNIITKAGSNELHGSLYEFFRNDIFDARDFFALTKPEYRQNQFGGSIGGPIVKDKTFFFGDIEEYRIVQGLTQTVTVPTLFEEQNPGNFADIGGPVIPSGSINSVGLNFFKLYPAPNRPRTVNNYSSSFRKTQYSTTTDVRVDHQFNESNSMFARFDYNPVSTFIPGALPPVHIFGTTVDPGGILGGFAGPSKTTSYGSQLNYIHIFSPTLLMELKAGYTRINIATTPLNYGTNLGSKFGVVNANIGPDSSALPLMWPLAADYATVGDGFYLPIFNTNNVFQYNGTLTWTHGAHNVKFGAAVIRRQLNYFQDSFSPQGGFAFLPLPPFFNTMASLLTGEAAFGERGNTLVHPGYRTWEPSTFIQDDWHAKPWLTLNLGLRYEVFTPFTEAHNQFSNFNLATLKVFQATSADPTMGVRTDYGNVSPRIGFAATLPRNVVVRGGYGISYFPTDTVGNTNPPYNYLCIPCFATSFPVLPLPSATSITNPAGQVSVKPADFRSAYIQQFNFMVQKAIGQNVVTVGYVGELGRRLVYDKNADLPVPTGPVPVGTPPPPYVYAAQLPNVVDIDYSYNGATSSYNALQAVFTRRYSKGLTFNANYTFAHGLSDSTNKGTSTNPLGLVVNNMKYDWGNSDIDVRHRVAVSVNYELPFGKSMSGLRGGLVKGWQANMIAFWQTGLPFTVTSGTDFINLPGVTIERPNQIASASIQNPTINEWFNTSAFAHQTLGTPGDEGRNQFYGPHERRVDLSLFKNFPIRERLQLQFRAECYNISNTATFANPSNSFGAPGFGTISSTIPQVGPRQFQFALKLMF